MVYTVRRKCEELPELEYDDGDVTLYLFVNGKPEDDTPGNLVQLLHFMGETNWENACNPSLKKLMEYVEELKRDPEVKEAYMHWLPKTGHWKRNIVHLLPNKSLRVQRRHWLRM